MSMQRAILRTQLCSQLFFGVVATLFSALLQASLCTDVFPSGVQNFDPAGSIIFAWDTQLLFELDIRIETYLIEKEQDSGLATCESQDCIALNQVAESIPPPPFQFSTGTTSLELKDGAEFTLGSDNLNQHEKIKVSAGSILNVSHHYSSYRMRELEIEDATVNLAPGDYWLEKFKIKNAVLKVIGTGTARIFVLNKVDIGETSLINSPAVQVAGAPEALLIYAYEEVKIKEGTTVSALTYSNQKFEIGKQAYHFGAINALEVKLKKESLIYSVLDNLFIADLAPLCEQVNPNQAPLSNAGPDQSVTVGTRVSLDGSGSTDADGDALTFSWSIDALPTGSGALLSNPTAVMPEFSVDVPGTYLISLIVDDGAISSAPDTVAISTHNSPPVAHAGTDQSVFVTDLVTLDASGSSDVDGNALTFAWSFASKPIDSVASLSQPTATDPTFRVDKPGTYVLQLIVNDGTVDSSPDSVSITTLNSAPVANAGVDHSAFVTDRVILNGSASNDADGDALSFNWSLSSIPLSSSATLSDPTAVMPTFDLDVPGIYVAQLIVNDGSLNSAPHTVTVTTVNSAPVAQAGADQTVFVTDLVSLDGSASSDVDGDTLSFLWSLTSKPVGSQAILSAVTAVMPTFEADFPGVYVAQLIIHDGSLSSAPDTLTITTQNSAPIAKAGTDQSVLVTATVTLDGTGSTDVDGDNLTFSWSLTSQPLDSTTTLSDASAVLPTFEVDAPGIYVAQLIVNDGVLASAPDTVTITTENSPPIAHAGADQTLFVTDSVSLDGSASTDVDGDTLTFSWALTTVPSGSGAVLSDPAAVMPTFLLDLPGLYVAQLIINDGTVDSVPDTIAITTLNSAPSANAGADQTGFVTDTITLNAGASSDVDGDTLSYLWSLTAVPVGSAATLSDPISVTPNFVIDLPGTYVAQLLVNDGTLSSSPDSVTITTENSRPVANAGADQNVFVTDLVTLDATGSSDVDGDNLSYNWSLTVKPAGSVALLSDPVAVQPSFIVDKPGTYVGQLIVNDGVLDSAPDTTTINTQNSAPIAHAGDDQNITLGDTATLDASGSVDLDGDLLSYQWTLVSAPVGSIAILTDSTLVSPSLMPDEAGDYLIQLIVHDGTVASAADSVTVSAEVFVPLSIELDSPTDGSLTNQAEQTLIGRLSKAGQLSIDGNAVPLNADHSFAYAVSLIEGNNSFELQASHPDGETDQLQITLILDSQAPSRADEELVFVTTATSGQVTIIGDPNSTDAATQVTITNERTGETATTTTLADGSFAFDFAAENGDTLSVVVADSAGNQSATLSLQVGAGLPTFDPIGDKVALLGQSLSFTVTASAPGDTHVELGIAPVPLPARMEFDISTGAFSFTPRAEQVGNIVLTFHARTRAGEVTETINLSVPAPEPLAPTRYIGQVMDATSEIEGVPLPIVGARVSFLGSNQSVVTDTNGQFVLTDLPSGEQIFDIDSSNATVAPGGAPYASFREKLFLIAAVDNIVVRPFFLPRIDVSSSTTINPVQTSVVENENLGVSMTIPPNTAFNLDGSPFVGQLSISEVPENLAPMALPESFDPAMLITIQPVGVVFTQPVPLTFPNFYVDLPPGSEMELWSVNPDTGLFHIVGEGRISSDGQRIETVAGGVVATTWHFLIPLPPVVNSLVSNRPNDNANSCASNFGSTVNVQNGCLQTDFELPHYRSLETDRNLRFVYESGAAQPHPVMPFNVDSVTTGFEPKLTLSVGGVAQGEQSLNYPISPQQRRTAVAFDAADFDSGLFDYTVSASAKYGFRRVRCDRRGCRIIFGTVVLTGVSRDEVRIVNETNSHYGAGWLLADQAKLHLNPGNDAFIVFGDNKTVTFRFDAADNSYVTPQGNYSTLQKLPDTSFVLTDKHGMVTEFTATGKQTATIDRNGNRTEYGYNSVGQLVSIRDPIGKETALIYAPVTSRLSSIVDPAGRITSFEHNGVGDLTKVTFPDNSFKTFQYDHRHLMTAETDERGHTTTRTYDSLGRAIRATLPDGSTRATSNSQSAGVVDFGDPTVGTELNPIQEATPADAVDRLVDANGNLEISTADTFGHKTMITDAIDRVLSIERDEDGNATKITRADGSEIALIYDAQGNLLSQSEAFNGAITRISYDSEFNLIGSITDARDNVFLIRRDNAGNATEFENALGHITYVQYDSRGLVTQMTGPNGLITSFIYNANGLLESQTETPPDATPARLTQMQYDLNGQLSQLQQPDGVVLDFDYDDRGRLTHISDNLNQQISFTYDDYGNLKHTNMTNADASLARTLANIWDKRNRLSQINAAGSMVHNLLDNNSNLTGFIDANGNQSSQVFDAVNRLVESNSPLNGVTRFEYDVNDALTSVQAPNGVVTRFVNDALSRVTQEISGDRGTLNYTYDLANNVTSITDARGITASFSYDALNRVSNVTYADAAENVTYIYDSCAFGLGRLCGRIDESGISSFEYDAFGNLITEQHTELAVTYTTGYQYDAGNNLIAMTLPSGRVIDYGRDGVRRLSSISTTVNGVVGDVVSNLAYRVDGQMTQRSWGNGLNESRVYDLQGRLSSQALDGTDSRLYAYDANGNMLSQTASAQNKDYVYDSLDRLITDTTDGAEIDLTYDLNGNRLGRSAEDGSLQEHNDYLLGSNRLALSDLVASTLPTLTPPAERVFNYNNRGRLYQLFDNGVLMATYVYNAEGLRSRKITDLGTTIYHYDQFGLLISETSSDGTLIRDYVWQGFEPVAQIDSLPPSENIVYLHTDHLNTPGLATDSSQSVQWRWQGEAFGLTSANEDVDGDSNLTTVNLRFPGQYYDSETGLHYNYFRYYDPNTGRYITSDPIGLRGGINTYTYALNNPLFYTDPLGLEVGDWWDFPANLERAREIAREELSRRPRSHNDIGDAMRHAEWMRRTKEETNACTAWLAGSGHEIEGLLDGQPWEEAIMDLHNNAVGRDAAGNNMPVDQSKLWTLPNNGSSYNPYRGVQ